MSFFELINLSSGNRVGDYDTEPEALRAAWEAVQRRGESALDSIALWFEDDDGHGKLIAESDDLVRRAKPAEQGALAVY